MRQRSNLIILFGIAFFIVGGAIVFLVLNDDDDGGSASSSTPGAAKVTVLVANGDIAANTLGSDVIANGQLDSMEVDAGAQPVGALTSATGLDNQIFTLAVDDGNVITSTALATRSLSNVQIPPGFDGVAVTVDYTNGGAGYVAPGDRINLYGLFGSVDGGTGDAGLTADNSNSDIALPRTELALTNVLVLDVSAQQGTSVQTVDPNAPEQQQTVGRQALNTPLTYLLALRPTDIERVVQLSSFADLYVSLTADDAPVAGDTPGVTGGNVNGPVSADSAAPQS